MTPRHSRLHQPAVGLLPQHYLIGEGVSLPRITQIPFVLGAQPATLMAAAPVRQRSGPGGPRTQLPPCYYEGYLEKRGPKEKVGPQTKCHVVSVHAVMSRGRRVFMCVYERGGLCTAHRLIPPTVSRELSTSLLSWNGRGETWHWFWRGFFPQSRSRIMFLCYVCFYARLQSATNYERIGIYGSKEAACCQNVACQFSYITWTVHCCVPVSQWDIESPLYVSNSSRCLPSIFLTQSRML